MAHVSESTRERETLKYDPALIANTVVNESTTPRPSSELVTSSDAVLTAFAQLVALRLSATRALISLFDQKYQYVVAEATQSSPLTANTKPDSPGGELWLCGTAIPRAFGICEHVLHTESSHSAQGPQEPVTVLHNANEDDRFSNKPYSQYPFYAGVPIRSPRGVTIGVLCALDDKSRPEFDPVSTQVLRDVSVTIMDYLASRLSRFHHGRTQRMVRGLGSFVEGKATISGWSEGRATHLFDNRPGKEGSLNERQQRIEDGEPPDSITNESPFQIPEPSPGLPAASPSYFWSKPRFSGPISDSEQTPQPTSVTDTFTAIATPSEAIAASQTVNMQVRSVFARASNILRESIEVEGVLFVDAAIRSFGGLYKRGGSNRPDGSDSSQLNSSSDDNERHDDSSEPRLCTVLGFSTTDSSSVDAPPATSYRGDVPERLLAKLIQRYPKGKIFNFDEHGSAQSSDSSEAESKSRYASAVKYQSSGPPKRARRSFSRPNESAEIIKSFPGARSIALVPLWDTRKQSWFAVGFAFTRDPTRALTVEGEVSYLRATGMVVMSEVSHIEVMIADKAKSDALGSLSHELRSPLHGLLLGAELLSETRLDVFQGNMLHTMETCGRTLLDTIDNLLDYSKINNFMKQSSQRRQSEEGRGLRGSRAGTIEAGMSSLSADAHLDLVAEEVVDSLYLGHIFQRTSVGPFTKKVLSKSSSPHSSRGSGSTPVAEAQRDPSEKSRRLSRDVFVWLEIDPSCPWFFYVQPGAIRRILMNLFGNSLKYTDRGAIKVSLQQDGPTRKSHDGHRMIRIVVEDTGRGISEDYLRNHLFQPFTQEDYLTSGAGLGLSLVKRLTTSLKGSVKVDSRIGRGTKVTVSIPLLPAEPPSPGNTMLETEADFAARVNQLAGLRVCLRGFGDDENAEHQHLAETNKKLIETTCREWLRMRVVSPNNTDGLIPDIFLCTEAGLDSLLDEKRGSGFTPTVTVCRHVLAARQKAASLGVPRGRGILEFISQPVGPRKLAKALLLCLNRWTEAQPGLAYTNESIPEVSDMEVDTNGPMSPSPPPAEPSTEELGGWASLTVPQSTVASKPTRPSSAASSKRLSIGAVISGDRKSDAAESVPSSKKFLLVDDNAVNLQILAAYMKKLGYAYTTATNGREAYDAYTESSGQFSYVFMDISMPVMDGFVSSQLIRGYEREHQLEKTQIVALTGLASEEAQREAFASGIDIFLTKPVRFKELSQIVSQRNN